MPRGTTGARLTQRQLNACSKEEYAALHKAASTLALAPMVESWGEGTVLSHAAVADLILNRRIPPPRALLSAWKGVRYRLDLDVAFNPFPLREALVRRRDDDTSPLMKLGRNPHAIRLLIMMHTRRNHLAASRDHEWAALLGFGPTSTDPDVAANQIATGSRRISRARAALRDAGLLYEARNGAWLLNEADPTTRWSPPTMADEDSEDRWFRVPWWIINNGWLATLDYKAISTLLVVLSWTGGRKGERRAPSEYHKRAVRSFATMELGTLTRESNYDLSEKVFLDGARTLINFGLLSRDVVPDPANPVTAKKSFYRLNAKMMQRTPIHVPEPIEVKPVGNYVEDVLDVDGWL